jgi:hypothetical protein
MLQCRSIGLTFYNVKSRQNNAQKEWRTILSLL